MSKDKWNYDDLGTWRLDSDRIIERSWYTYSYRIQVQEDGSFDTSESDDELIRGDNVRHFPTLLEAQRYCEAIEFHALEPSPFAGDER